MIRGELLFLVIGIKRKWWILEIFRSCGCRIRMLLSGRGVTTAWVFRFRLPLLCEEMKIFTQTWH